MSRQIEYIVAGVVALYIVFMTRPAPRLVTNLLASPIAQLVLLAVVICVGSKYSMLVALLLGVAFVASVPAREYMDVESVIAKVEAGEKSPEAAQTPEDCKLDETFDENKKKCMRKEPVPADPPTEAGKETFGNYASAAF